MRCFVDDIDTLTVHKTETKKSQSKNQRKIIYSVRHKIDMHIFW